MPASLALADPFANYTRSELWANLSSLKLESTPPCAAVYSNLGLGLVGELLSRYYDKPWADLVSAGITQLLGMKYTTQNLESKASRFAQGHNNQAKVQGLEFKAMAVAGALRSTVSDMLTFSRAMMAGSAGPLGPAVQRLLQPLGKFQFAQIGYAVFIRGPEGKRRYVHDGLTAGCRAQWIISPGAQEAVIALASNSHAPTSKMQNLLLAGLYPPTAQISAAPVGNIAEYSGTYRIEKSTAVAFVLQNAQLYRRIAGGVFRPLLPAGTDVFVDPEVGVQYGFQRRNGELVSVVYSQGGGGFTAFKTNEPVPAQAIVSLDKAKEYVGRYLLERSARRNIDFDFRQDGGQFLVRSSNWQRQPVFPKPGATRQVFL